MNNNDNYFTVNNVICSHGGNNLIANELTYGQAKDIADAHNASLELSEAHEEQPNEEIGNLIKGAVFGSLAGYYPELGANCGADLIQAIDKISGVIARGKLGVGLEEKEPSSAMAHVLQKIRELVTLFAERERGYSLLKRFEGADLIDECRKDLEELLSSHSNAASALPVSQEFNCPPKATQTAPPPSLSYVQQMERDTQRLDWLISKADTDFFRGLPEWLNQAREAIDAAMIVSSPVTRVESPELHQAIARLRHELRITADKDSCLALDIKLVCDAVASPVSSVERDKPK